MPDKPHRVILIHGTFAHFPDNAADTKNEFRWWLRGSNFWKRLQKELNAASPSDTPYIVQPSGEESPEDLGFFTCAEAERDESSPPESVFHWSGENSEAVRRQAAMRLLLHLQRQDELGPFSVVAHSHGGSVLWRTLCEAKRSGKPLSNLTAWVTVATPFLHFRPNYSQLWILAPLVLTIVLAYCQNWWGWWCDFWLQQFPEFGFPALLNFCFALFVYATAVLPICVSLRTLWSLYCWRLADSEGQERRNQIECADFKASMIALGSTILLVLAVGLVLYVGAKNNLTEGSESLLQWATCLRLIEYCFLSGWTSAKLAIATLWTLAFIGIVFFWYGWEFLRFFILTRKSRRDDALRREAFKDYGDRFRPVAWEVAHLDEAMQGLRAIRRPPKGPLLPRWTAPRTLKFDENGRPRYPERAALQLQFVKWLTDYLFLPLGILRDWVARPLYNDLFATLIDDYVLKRLTYRGQGADLPGYRFVDATAHPFTDAERRKFDIDPLPPVDAAASGPRKTPEEEAEAVARKTWDEQLNEQSQRESQALIRRLRETLAFRIYQGIRFPDVFRAAMGDEKAREETARELPDVDVGRLLYHTGYFDTNYVMGQVITAIIRTDVPKRNTLGDFRHRGDIFHRADTPSMYDYIFFLLRWAVRLAIFLLPVVFLAAVANAAYYPSSKDYHLDAARNESDGLSLSKSLMLRDSEVPTSPSSDYDSFPKWCVTHALLDDFPDRNLSEISSPLANSPQPKDPDSVWKWESIRWRLARLIESSELPVDNSVDFWRRFSKQAHDFALTKVPNPLPPIDSAAGYIEIAKLWYADEELEISSRVDKKTIRQLLLAAEIEFRSSAFSRPQLAKLIQKASSLIENEKSMASQAEAARYVACSCFRYGFYADATSLLEKYINGQPSEKIAFWTEIRCFQIAKMFRNRKLASVLSPAVTYPLSRTMN